MTSITITNIISISPTDTVRFHSIPHMSGKSQEQQTYVMYEYETPGESKSLSS